MNTILADIQQRAAVLPLALQTEVLHYMMFLQQKVQQETSLNSQHTTPYSSESFTDWNNAEFSKMAMNQAMCGMENEPALYESLTDDEQNTQQLLERIKNIKRVTAPYSSEEMVAMLRAGKEHLLVEAVEHYAKK